MVSCSRTQDEGHPKWFVLGVGHVIKGLDIAMMDMCPGEKRRVIIPPSFAYGKEGYGKNLCLRTLFRAPVNGTYLNYLIPIAVSFRRAILASPCLVVESWHL